MDHTQLKPPIDAPLGIISQGLQHKNRPPLKTILKHSALFLATFVTVTLMGSVLVGLGNNLSEIGSITLPGFEDIKRGAVFAALLLAFLTFHEFGHYFAAVYHNIKVTLPYYIPVPFGIGTLGAVIRIKERIHETRQLFDIGIAGPLSGFVVSIIILLIGFFTLPEPSVVQSFGGHQELKNYVEMHGEYPAELNVTENGATLIVGNTLLFKFITLFFDNVPPMWELYHFPFLFAGWLGLFFTALNLMPVGQLDGGHILYALIGYKKHRIFARLFFTFISVLAGIESVPLIHSFLGTFELHYDALAWLIWGASLFAVMSVAFKREMQWVSVLASVSLIISFVYIYFIAGPANIIASSIWLVWLLFITFLIKIEHPPVTNYEPLSPGRKILGWLSMLIFVLCISLNPLTLI